VVIINARDVKFSGKKLTDKFYKWHTGYPGGLKERSVRDQLDIKPEEVLRKAILGMMAKNHLRRLVAKKLRIFPGEKHLHEDKLPSETTKPINI
jgi:large subunit ribosomal protein L13